MRFAIWASTFVVFFSTARAAVINFKAAGGIPNENSLQAEVHNRDLLNQIFAEWTPGDELLLADEFWIMGGVEASDFEDLTLIVDATLHMSNKIDDWPRKENFHVLECIHFKNGVGLTLTSSKHRGTINGHGQPWWGLPLLGYLRRTENRPRLLTSYNVTDMIVENLLLIDSPYWTTKFASSKNLIIRHSDISARRTKKHSHGMPDITAFNTDGFDFTGRDIHVHDCTSWAQDDNIAVKDNTQNVLVERVNISGLGLTIGSIGGSNVNNVTFRDCFVKDTFKGIYLKFRHGADDGMGNITNVLYENIRMDGVEQFGIFMGPAQQSDSTQLCAPRGGCSICYGVLPKSMAPCAGIPNSHYENITFRNIEMNNVKNPGVVMGALHGESRGMIENVVFENVVVNTCVPSSYLINFKETFPNLPTDIYDYKVAQWRALIIVPLLFLCVMPCCYCLAVGDQCARFWSRDSPTFKLKIGCCGVLMALLASFGLVFLAGAASLDDQSKYFACEGVSAGFATGDTHPVPACFEDLTNPSKKPKFSCGPNVAGIVLGVMGALGAIMLGAFFGNAYLKKKWPFAPKLGAHVELKEEDVGAE